MTSRTIYIGADHAGFKLKEALKPWLLGLGYGVGDVSPKLKDGDDYPGYGKKVAQLIAKRKQSVGVLVCGSGVGISIAANRVKGARAFDAFDAKTTKMAREHNDANIIALSGWHLSPAKAKALVSLFLKTPFSKEARHHRRVKQLG